MVGNVAGVVKVVASVVGVATDVDEEVIGADRIYASSVVMVVKLLKLTVNVKSPAMVKALVWFWIIDETLVLTSMLSVCRLNEVGTCQVMEKVMIMVMMVMTTR